MGWRHALRDGVTAGLLLAGAEAVVTVTTGAHLPPGLIGAVIAFDVAVGVAAALLGTLVRWRLRADHDFAARFLPLAWGLCVIHVADKVELTAVFRGPRTGLVAAVLALCGAALVAAALPVSRRIVRTANPAA